jgi:hypothetical protein
LPFILPSKRNRKEKDKMDNASGKKERKKGGFAEFRGVREKPRKTGVP